MDERKIKFMQMAIDLSLKGMKDNHGGPFGAIVVKGDLVIGRGYNMVLSTNDPTAHAEMVAIREATRFLNNFQLEGCEIYTSCEPCPMCLGAIYWARPERVYFGNTRIDAANIGFDDSLIYEELQKNFNDRKISLIQIGRKEASCAFDEWRTKSDKVDY